MARHGMSDRGWDFIKDLFPQVEKPQAGRPWVEHRKVLDGIFWILRTGSPWRDLPQEFGSWETVYGRYRRWSRDGTFETVLEKIIELIHKRGDIDWELWCLDGTIIRAARCAGGAPKKNMVADEPADHALGRSQGGFTTKIHVKADGKGHLLAIVLTAGQAHESTQFEAVMGAGPLPIVSVNSKPVTTKTIPKKQTHPKKRPKAVAGDKGYSAQRIRDWCDRNNIEDVIPTRKNEPRRDCFDKEKYRKRNIVERAIGWLKECRRVMTRFEKYAVHYHAFVQLAIIQRFMNVEL